MYGLGHAMFAASSRRDARQFSQRRQAHCHSAGSAPASTDSCQMAHRVEHLADSETRTLDLAFSNRDGMSCS